MKYQIGRFSAAGEPFVGALVDRGVVSLGVGDDLPAALSRPDSWLRPALEGGRHFGLDEVETLAPLDPASRVFAVALNYRDHAAEANSKPFPRPLFFYKPPSSFVADGGVLDLSPELTGELDYEGEIAVVLGRSCRGVTPDAALDQIAGVCSLMDGSARDLQMLSTASGPIHDWLAGKSLERSSSLGPTIVRGPEVDAALRERRLRINTRLNSELVQDAGIDELVFSVEELVSTLSAYFTLRPGDVIATGTPGGIGAARGRFLRQGDSLEVAIPGVCSLSIGVGELLPAPPR